MSYATGYQRGRGIFSASGLGGPYSRDYRGLFGLGQTTTKTSTSPTTDQTAHDWTTALTTGGGLVSQIIGAATGQPSAIPGATATTTPAVDPATATAPPVSASPDWYWPVIIGVGAVVIGGIAYMSFNVKKPVAKNRGRRSKPRRRSGQRLTPKSSKTKAKRRRANREAMYAAHDRFLGGFPTW